ncbi:unnamed protein product [Urochloa humidicola]
MRRFLIGSRNQLDEPGVSHGTQRNSNGNEPREVPVRGHTEAEPNLEPESGEILGNPEAQPNLESHEVPDHEEAQPSLGNANAITEFNPNDIQCDPALRKQIYEYAPEIQEQVRRAYILKGPTQPTNVIFPRTQYGPRESRAFSKRWYKKYNWLEYSESKDAGFCFYCFLFKEPGRPEHFGYDVFNRTGWRDWKHAYKSLPDHVGSVGSTHDKCVKKCDDFKNQRQGVAHVLFKANKRSEELYETRLASTLRCSRFLLKQGMPFRGHDETATSLNKGNLLELIDFLKDNNEEVRDAYDRGGLNCKMTSHMVQKDLARCCAEEITEAIMTEIGDRQFSVLIDESRDISVKEQMAVIIRYVNSRGSVVERFLALIHVTETTSQALKEALFGVLDRHKLSVSRIRGQGYDGASNMRGEFNGLQKKILDENPYAFYVHCFAHQLQLVVVSIANCCSSVHDFFEYVSLIVTTTSASCKRRDALIESHHQNILDRLGNGETSTGRGLNQETILARPGDTRWGSHHTTLVRLSQMWDSVIEVLRLVHEDARVPSQAAGLIEKMECFQFVFILKLMLRLLGITNELSHLLQRKDINIVNALELIQDVKARLNTMRESGWDDLIDEVREFCEMKGIPIPNMSDEIPVRGRSRRDGFTVTNLYHYRAEIFYVVVDKICAEMNHRFGEATTELLMCFSCLDPKNSFSKFDVDRLARLAEIYDADFCDHDRGIIREQLETYIVHVRRHAAFASCTDIASLATKMVETEKHLAFPLVYKLIELALLVPVSTATVERSFSAMKILKTKLRNKIANDWFNNLMICYIEKELFKSLDEAAVLQRFQNIKTRKMQLPRARKPA